jgi:hypothetical protein
MAALMERTSKGSLSAGRVAADFRGNAAAAAHQSHTRLTLEAGRATLARSVSFPLAMQLGAWAKRMKRSSNPAYSMRGLDSVQGAHREEMAHHGRPVGPRARDRGRASRFGTGVVIDTRGRTPDRRCSCWLRTPGCAQPCGVRSSGCNAGRRGAITRFPAG